MDSTTVITDCPSMYKLAARACHEHNEKTLIKSHCMAGETKTTLHEYQSTDIHWAILHHFKANHGEAFVREGYLVESVMGKTPFILDQGGRIRAKENEVLIIIPLGYLQTYPSKPKPASGSSMVQPDGDYEPVVLQHIRGDEWSNLQWKTGTYISTTGRIKVQAGAIFGEWMSITCKPDIKLN
ncbi:hypothetical protein B0J13DRAFT_569287 [Dactylonectria estremocensis]|uniref:Uncharacterized protein n=1 Tax=Dactylonectria estremocensis TaxID=1079267 RepID=A0A9P9DIF1_9HYPO|nr:hypothetical protein B0J13DRAFT_569287 [Dactylonectria estremocensis]